MGRTRHPNAGNVGPVAEELKAVSVGHTSTRYYAVLRQHGVGPSIAGGVGQPVSHIPRNLLDFIHVALSSQSIHKALCMACRFCVGFWASNIANISIITVNKLVDRIDTDCCDGITQRTLLHNFTADFDRLLSAANNCFLVFQRVPDGIISLAGQGASKSGGGRLGGVVGDLGGICGGLSRSFAGIGLIRLHHNIVSS